MILGVLWWLVAAAGSGAAERWQWPEGAASVRIDTKVRFLDGKDENQGVDTRVQADEVPFREPTDTGGFYNRPPGAGRYPVRSQAYKEQYFDNRQPFYANKIQDGTLDSLQFCKCLSQPDCLNPRPDSERACGVGKFLCCYQRPNQMPHNSEVFNEVDDERPNLLPSQEGFVRPFPPPPGSQQTGFFGPFQSGQREETPVLVGPNGPTGTIGPQKKPDILVGPDGPTGVIGPNKPNVLVGPGGPTGFIGPNSNNNDVRQSGSAQRGVLVGPGGPTGIIGPGGYGRRPVLVGPGGPTGIIGPGNRRNPGVLVGPGGPTGIVGPAYGNRYGRQGILTGPGGPTGTIGPGRQILVGPGGPTGARVSPATEPASSEEELKIIHQPPRKRIKMAPKVATCDC